jgi:hypothetical protein
MNTLTVDSTGIVRSADTRQILVRKVLLACGILSSLLYVAAIILGAMRWEGYSSTSQTVSELIAIDAPSAPLVVPLFLTYSILIFAFGLGIWLSAGRKRALRIAACLIIGKEILGVAATLFFPLHLRGIEGTQSDIMHGIFTAVGVLLCMFPAMGYGAVAFGKKFRLYSIGTMLIFLVFGVLAGFDQPGYVANLPTPWMGIYERINIYGYLLWIVVLAIALLRKQSDSLRFEDRESNVHPEAATNRV